MLLIMIPILVQHLVLIIEGKQVTALTALHPCAKNYDLIWLVRFIQFATLFIQVIKHNWNFGFLKN